MNGTCSGAARRRPSVLLPLPAGPSTVTTRERCGSAIVEADRAAQPAFLIRRERTRRTLGQAVERDRADRGAHQVGDVEPDRRAHAPHLALATLRHGELE